MEYEMERYDRQVEQNKAVIQQMGKACWIAISIGVGFSVAIGVPIWIYGVMWN